MNCTLHLASITGLGLALLTGCGSSGDTTPAGAGGAAPVGCTIAWTGAASGSAKCNITVGTVSSVPNLVLANADGSGQPQFGFTPAVLAVKTYSLSDFTTAGGAHVSTLDFKIGSTTYAALDDFYGIALTGASATLTLTSLDPDGAPHAATDTHGSGDLTLVQYDSTKCTMNPGEDPSCGVGAGKLQTHLAF
jgi:hypothetical protein